MLYQSIFPIGLHVGEKFINLHLFFETLAMFVGYRYYLFLKKDYRDNITDLNRIYILIGAGLGAFIFSRLIGALENPIDWFQSPHPFLYFFLNKTIIGGLLGGLIGVEITKFIINEKSSSGDLFVLPLIIAMIIGRIGCFFSGITEPTFGIETKFILGMNLGDGLLRHPVALYEIGYLSLLFVVLNIVLKRNNLRSGVLFHIFMIAYFLFRFCIEFIKPTYKVNFGLSTIQFVCVLVLLYYYKTFFNILLNRKSLV